MKFGDPAETKNRIMKVAFELFGQYGLEGASVRDIAKKSNSNIAAINYHFGTKENLFWEVMYETYRDLNRNVEIMYQDSKDVYQLSDKLLDYFHSEKIALKNTMKMLLTDGLALPTDPRIIKELNNPFGPPGGQYFQEMIQKECPFPLSRMGSMWGVKSIFGSIMHWSVMLCSDKVCVANENDELLSDEQIKKDVLLMVRSSIEFLKSNKKLFSD